LGFYPLDSREKTFNMIKSVQRIGKQYLFGMMIVVLILGFVNSIELLIIGIDNPFLFGCLAGFLALIHYVGTFIGAAGSTI
jgi:predicted PurR-regulated permease PerM